MAHGIKVSFSLHQSDSGWLDLVHLWLHPLEVAQPLRSPQQCSWGEGTGCTTSQGASLTSFPVSLAGGGHMAPT